MHKDGMLPEGIALGRREFSPERRSIGAYYTSRSVADTLSSWAIRSGSERVLEPSFGGCEFITSARSRLSLLGGREPLKQVFGADVDIKAFDALEKRHPDALAENFQHGDFLGMTVDDLAQGGVDVVIGNPPYVRHHTISEDVFVRASRLRDAKLADLSMQANLWAFFVIHACSFLRPHGRMAWVLPQNYLYASYAKSVRRFLKQHFGSIVEIEIKQHLFESEGAAEKSVLVFCDDWNAGAVWDCVVKRFYASSLDDVVSILNYSEEHEVEQTRLSLDSTKCSVTTIGALCDVKIGAVLGDARFFTFDSCRAREKCIDPALLRLAATRASVVQGLTLTTDDLVQAFQNGEKVAVLDTAVGIDDHVRAYLSSMPDGKVRSNATFRKRSTWHQPFKDVVPIDALFTGMSHLFPRLALNPDNLRCTNTLYELRFKHELNVSERLQLPLSMISSFGQLSSEIEGRPYGSGLLKHEPSDVRRIQVISVEARQEHTLSAFKRADLEMKRGNAKAATLIADRFFVAQGGLSNADIEKIKRTIKLKRGERLKYDINKA